jgi:hypothetical protein
LSEPSKCCFLFKTTATPITTAKEAKAKAPVAILSFWVIIFGFIAVVWLGIWVSLGVGAGFGVGLGVGFCVG